MIKFYHVPRYVGLFFPIVILSFFTTSFLNAQCTNPTNSAPTPQMGAMMSPQFVNLWRHAPANDKYGKHFKENGGLSIGDDGWPIAGVEHGIRFYPNDVFPQIQKNDVLKFRFKGTKDQLIDRHRENCTYENIQEAGGYVTANIVISSNYPLNGLGTNGFKFGFEGHIEDIQIVRPGYDFDDPRYVVDEYVQHVKTAGWKAFRLMGMMGVNGNSDQTWAKRLSKNAPNGVNVWQTAIGELNYNNKETWAQDMSNGANENNLPGQNGADGRMRGSPWETQIDVCNYLNLDMWINLPVLVDDDYIKNLALLLKQRLKPSLNVNIEIGNEMWNVFGPHFRSGSLMYQALTWEFKYGTPEQKKIFGGALCPGCDLRDSYTANGDFQAFNYDAQQRWMARRLKEHAESFATVFGWRDEGGEVGTKIRMVLSGQIYGSNGHGWNIGPGIEFLQRAYGNDAPGKYLYAVAIAPYFSPHANPDKETEESFLNMSIDEIERRVNKNIDSYFNEFETTPWTTNPRPAYFGNFLEGLFAKARMFGLKLYTYEGGNELSTGGVPWFPGDSQRWVNQVNADAFLSSPRAAAASKRFFDRWYSWFGYDALFMKNGDYQEIPMGGYAMSHTLNEELPMRMEYARIANSPAPPLSKERGNLLTGESEVFLDARKTAGYGSDWENNVYGFPVTGYTTVANPDYTLKSENSFERPYIIRCEKGGKYKFSMERSIANGSLATDKQWPTYIDIYLNEKLIVSGQSMPVQAISRKIKYDVDGGERTFGFTDDIILDIPYGVHVLRITPSLPTPSRPGNQGHFQNNIYSNNFELAQYRFRFDGALPPKKPKAILGDIIVCKSNTKAKYEVSEIDQGACEYVWSDLPSGATILPKELVAGSNPQRFLSGQGTYKIYIDWGSVPVGSYPLKLVAENVVGASEPLIFTVKVQTCGFEVNPTPVCKGEMTTFTPEPMEGIISYKWDNGEIGKPDRFTINTNSSPYTHKYDVPGTYSVSLEITDALNNVVQYHNTINVTACNEPVVATPVRYCKGENAEPLTAILGTNKGNPGIELKWYTSATGGTSAPSITPATSTAGTTAYYVSQVYSTGTESDRAKIEVIVIDAPDMPEIVGDNPFDFCETATSGVNDIVNKVRWAAGATPKWYTVSEGGTSMVNPTVPAAGETNVKIYVSAEMGECESPRAVLTIRQVNTSPEFRIVENQPTTCGENGKILLRGEVAGKSLIANQTYKVSHSGLAPVDMIAEARSGVEASAQIILDLPPGNYNNFSVTTADGGCTYTLAGARTIQSPGGDAAQGGTAKADKDTLPVGGSTNIVLLGSKGTIKWQMSKDGEPYSDIPENSSTINTGTLSQGVYSYKALLTNGACTEPVSSVAAVIKVGTTVPKKITASTTTSEICSGSTASLTLKDYTGTIQWQDSITGGVFTNIEGATEATLTTAALDKNTWYRAKVSTPSGDLYSNTVAVTVNPAAVGGTASAASETLTLGANTDITLTDYTGTIKWQLSTDGTTYTDVTPAATEAVLNTGALTTEGDYYYRAVVTSGTCTPVNSTVAKVTVMPSNRPIASTTTSEICAGSTASLTLKDYTGTIQWQDSITGGVFTNIEGAIEATLSTEALNQNTWYRAKVSTPSGDAYSNTVAVTVSTAAVGGTANGSAPILKPGENTDISLTGHTGGTLIWQSSTDGTTYTDIVPEQTGTTFNTEALTTEGTYYYRAQVTNGICGPVNSTPAQVIVRVPSNAGLARTNNSQICEGSTVDLTLTDYTGTIQWQDSTAGGVFTNIEGATEATHITAALNQSTWYRAKVSTTTGDAYSNNVEIEVTPPPSQGIVSGPLDASESCDASSTGYSLSISEATGTNNYQLYKDGVVQPNTGTMQASTYSFTNLKEAGVYTVKAHVVNLPNCTSDMNGSFVISPSVRPASFNVSGGATGCEGTFTSADITLSSSQANTEYSLISLGNTLQTQNGTEGSPLSFSIEAVASNNGNYSIAARNISTGCESIMQGEATIAIQAGVGEPAIIGQPEYCNKSTAELTAVVENATSKTWTLTPSSAGRIDNGIIAWEPSYIGPASITLEVGNQACGTEKKTTSYQVNVVSAPDVSIIIGDSIVCRGKVVTYQVTPQAGITYRWAINVNTSIDQDDSKGICKITYLDDVPKEGVLLSVTPESASCGTGTPKTKEIWKGKECDLFVPNVLTPNTTDGISVWQIEGVENFPKLNIEIFNRWGGKVHSYNGRYDKPWDGTMDGKPLPTSTYYYVIDKLDGSEKLTGSITVVRD